MEVLLMHEVACLGKLGDQIQVKAGYARNFLIPQGKAIPATKKNIELFKTRRTELDKKMADILSTAIIRANKINELLNVTIVSKAGKEGKLFGSIGIRDIANAVTSAGVKVVKNEVRLPNGVLRNTGEHKVYFQIHKDVRAQLNIIVVADA